MGRLHKTAALLAVAGAFWLAAAAAGQELPPWSNAPEGWTPVRTPWGAPDLTGIWSSKHSTPLERPDEYAGREFLTDEEIAALDAERARAEAGDATAGRDVRAAAGTPADVEGAYNNIFSTNLGTRYSRTKRTAMIIDPPEAACRRSPPRPNGADRSVRGCRPRGATIASAPACRTSSTSATATTTRRTPAFWSAARVSASRAREASAASAAWCRDPAP